MKPVYQTNFIPPDGNCFEACIASIFELDLDDVPKFDGDNWFGKFEKWLKRHDLYPICIKVSDCDENFIPQGYYLIGGKSPRGDFNHAIVGYNGKAVHDPLPNGGCELGETIDYILFIARLKLLSPILRDNH